MIFSSPLYGKVLRSEKTQTRRLVLPSHPKHKYQAGKRVAVQKGRGVPSEAHIILTAVRREQLGEITFEDARAEGFRTSFDFMAYWISLHDKAWVAKTEDECIALFAESPHDTKSPSELLDMRVRRRFDTRWASKEVWVLTFELDHSEQPRFLMAGSPLTDGGKARLMSSRKRKPGRAKAKGVTGPEEHGYAASSARSLPLEPEPIDEHTQEKYSREGFQGWAAREAHRERDREQLALPERLRRAQMEAKTTGADIAYLEGQILSRLRAAERKIHNHRAA